MLNKLAKINHKFTLFIFAPAKFKLNEKLPKSFRLDNGTIILAVIFYYCGLLASCSDQKNPQDEPQKIEVMKQQNDVPAVEIKDVDGKKTVFLDGKAIKASEFRDKYCFGKVNNETCNKVILVARIDSIDGGAMPRNW